MINIAICDNNKKDIRIIKNILNIIAVKNNVEINIDEFNSGKDIIKAYKKGITNYNVIFLEVDLNDICGIEVAKYIMERDKYVKFIILSRTTKYVFEGYDIFAIKYLIKPANEYNIEKELFKVIQMQSIEEKFYEINKKGIKKLIDLNEIYYFEANQRKVNVFMKNRKIDYYEKLENIEFALNKKGFIRCHRSYMVNISKINEIKKDDVILTNGDILPIGRKYKSNLIERLSYYLELKNKVYA